MGCGSWSTSSWDSYRKTSNLRSASVYGAHDSIYSSSTMKDELNPKNITMRESRDSVDHPKSTPIIIACDVTGSMSPVLNSVIQNLGTLNEELGKRHPVTDPQICFMGVGDCAAGDKAPLQVTQFESDIRQAEALRKIWLEQRGGGNNSESYTLPWYFAANKISADAIEKRGEKGFLFTIGDECCPANLTAEQIERVIGDKIEEDLTAEELLTVVSRNWNVFHLIIEEGNYYSNRYFKDITRAEKCNKSWELLGQNVIHVDDHTKLAEIIVSVMDVMAGNNASDVAGSWADASTCKSVSKAVNGLVSDIKNDVIEFA